MAKALNAHLTPLDPWICQKIGCTDALTPDVLADYQLKKLQETLNLVRQKSPFYRHRLANLPEKLTHLDDLAVFPFTTAQDIRESGLQMLCVSQDEIKRVVTLDSSGTSGPAKRVYFTETDQELTLDFFNIGMSTFTAPGDRVLILLPCERQGSVGDLLALGLQRMGAFPIKHGVVKEIAQTLQIMREQKVNVLVGIPNQVFGLARLSEEKNLKSVLLSTDHVPDPVIQVIESKWHCQVFNHYGMTEMGLGGGVECEAHRGYHMREADLYFEVINPESGQAIKAGEEGELVFTTLTRTGMPLIRYRTGDLSRILPGACPCGTNLKTFDKITTRLSGRISLVPDAMLTLAQLDDVLYAFEEILDFNAQLELSLPCPVLNLELFTLPGQKSSRFSNSLLQQLNKIPAINIACRAKNLEIKLNFSELLSYPILPRKRRIDVIHTEEPDAQSPD